MSSSAAIFRHPRVGPYLRLMRFDRPIGTLLLLWPTLWALWFAAGGFPDLKILLIFVAGVVVMRAAGCVINDYADRNIDPYVERTRDRPLARREIGEKSALMLFAILLAAAFALVALTNLLTILLALVGAFLAATYPFLKRYTYWPQIYLGAAFAWAVPMAYAAQTGEVTTLGWLLFAATVLWTTAYDTIYAMVDREDDVKIGVRSTAILLGDLDRIAIGIMQAAFLGALYLAGTRAGFGFTFNAGIGIAAVLIAYQLWLIRDRDRAECFRAFLNNNWVGLVIFVGLYVETM
ncbi:MAG: 4-hydroxybenzoate octaprenyltransferase [Xanthomonadales bacterium]|nr:4-hydroxybenzoate octaprenyltransferase [Xanthomonadales bacterium]